MNLELLDPFGRQIPDRVDATLSLAPHLHFRHHDVKASAATSGGAGGKKGAAAVAAAAAAAAAASEDQEWKAAYHVAFNRRGTYVAVGYGSGAVGVHNILNRTLCSLYRSDDPQVSPEQMGNGVTSVSWSRRSRTLLAGAAGDSIVHLYDTTHPFGPEESCLSIDNKDDEDGPGGGGGGGGGGYNNVVNSNAAGSLMQKRIEKKGKKNAADAAAAAAAENANILAPTHAASVTGPTPFCDVAHEGYILVKEKRCLTSKTVTMGQELPKLGHLRSLQETATALRLSSTTSTSTTTTSTTTFLPTTTATTSKKGSIAAGKDTASSSSKLKNKSSSGGGAGAGSSSLLLLRRYPCITFHFPEPVGGSLQVNPCCPTAGLAALINGSLLLFWFHPSAWIRAGSGSGSGPAAASATTTSGGAVSGDAAGAASGGDPAAAAAAAAGSSSSNSGDYASPKVIFVPLLEANESNFVTCASFDPHGNRVYAATKSGKLLGWDVTELMKVLSHCGDIPPPPPPPVSSSTSPEESASKKQKSSSPSNTTPEGVISSSSGSSIPSTTSQSRPVLPLVKPKFTIEIRPGNASVWHLLVSRSGKYLVINSADGALRLYSTATCWDEPEKVDKPVWMFQDVVSKVKFASCDLSGEGEYVVGGANGDDNRYELYIWNTSTGALMDKLTGSNVQLYSVAWHPTRAFLAVATSDGLVDVWGPRINWTAFAPDFQALPRNIEYVEREDEFDHVVVVVDNNDTNKNSMSKNDGNAKDKMNVEENEGDDKKPSADPDAAASSATITNTPIPMDVDERTSGRDNSADTASVAVIVAATDDNNNINKTTPTTSHHHMEEETASEDTIVDVQTIKPVPVFASDSEDETQVFSFETRLKNIILMRLGKGIRAAEKQDD